jgi:hypothetical protein
MQMESLKTMLIRCHRWITIVDTDMVLIAVMLPMMTMMPMGTMVPMVTIVAMAMMVAMVTIVPMINIGAIGDHYWSPLTPLNGDMTVRIAI